MCVFPLACRVAHDCHGYTGADLRALCREAAMSAIVAAAAAEAEAAAAAASPAQQQHEQQQPAPAPALRPVSADDFAAAMKRVGPSMARGAAVEFDAIGRVAAEQSHQHTSTLLLLPLLLLPLLPVLLPPLLPLLPPLLPLLLLLVSRRVCVLRGGGGGTAAAQQQKRASGASCLLTPCLLPAAPAPVPAAGMTLGAWRR